MTTRSTHPVTMALVIGLVFGATMGFLSGVVFWDHRLAQAPTAHAENICTEFFPQSYSADFTAQNRLWLKHELHSSAVKVIACDQNRRLLRPAMIQVVDQNAVIVEFEVSTSGRVTIIK